MNFPVRIRSAVTIARASNVDPDEVCRRIACNLESQGATNIETHEGKVYFRAERAMSNLNPLTPCRRGTFWVENVRGGIRIEYELDLFNLLLWTSAVAVFLSIFGLIALLQGSFVLLP